jgi:alanine dehydrogenase
MLVLDSDDVYRLADRRLLIDALIAMYARGCEGRERLLMSQPTAAGDMADCLIQAGWMAGQAFGVKIANVFYQNHKRGLPTVLGGYLLFDGNTGAPAAFVDGLAETFVKTAANSAAASQLLSNPDSEVLLMIGAGQLAPFLIKAHAAARPIKTVLIHNRTRENAEKLAALLSPLGLTVRVVDDVAAAAAQAHIICCATYASQPVLHGDWLSPGCHVDLVGGYRPDQREADDAVFIRAGGRCFVDARETTVEIAGDVIDPLKSGAIVASKIVDLFEVASGQKPGRTKRDEITAFKSGGGGHEDLAVALALFKAAGGNLADH